MALYKRFDELEAAGAVDDLREDMTARTKAYVDRPRPVQGITKVTRTSVRLLDPSITVEQDLMDHEGRVFARAGDVVNPLAVAAAPTPVMLMIDGDDPAQVEWAMGEGDEISSRIILVSGRPLHLTKTHGRRFYFDQDGIIARRFDVTAVPTRIEPYDLMLRITEVAVE